MQYVTNYRIYLTPPTTSTATIDWLSQIMNTPSDKFSCFQKRNPKIAHKKYDFVQIIDNNNTAIKDQIKSFSYNL